MFFAKRAGISKSLMHNNKKSENLKETYLDSFPKALKSAACNTKNVWYEKVKLFKRLHRKTETVIKNRLDRFLSHIKHIM